MQQPQGYVDPTCPQHVCNLHKSLYVLKQAPKAWFNRLTYHLFHLGFTASYPDPSLFELHTSKVTIFPLLYVDDIIITGNIPFHISHLVSQLQVGFSLCAFLLSDIKAFQTYILNLKKRVCIHTITRTKGDIYLIIWFWLQRFSCQLPFGWRET